MFNILYLFVLFVTEKCAAAAFCINTCYNVVHHLKEIYMFTFETLVDTYVKNTQAVFAYVQPEPVKTALLDLTAKQGEFALGFVRQVETAAECISKNMKEAAKTLFPNK
jgi:hypothetical protein